MVNGVSIGRVEDIWTASADLKRTGWMKRTGRIRLSETEPPPDYLFADQVEDLLKEDLAKAEKIGRRALAAHPFDPEARFLLGASLRRQGRHAEARDILSDLTRSNPQMGSAWREFGIVLHKLGARERAIEAFRNAIDEQPVEAHAWREMGTVLFADSDADRRGDDPRMIESRKAWREERYCDAEASIRPLVDAQPENVRALKLYGDILVYGNRWKEAKPVLERCVSLAPDFLPARFRFASLLLWQNEYGHAHREIQKLLGLDPQRNPLYRHMEAIVLGGGIQFARALPIYEQLLAEFPDRAGLWGQYLQLVRFARPDDSVRIYEEALRRFPHHVDFLYNVATVKSYRFDESWVERIKAALDRKELSAQSRVRLHFVLGKAYEDLKQYAKSFEHYKASNDILFENKHPDGDERTDFKWRSKAVYTRPFFRVRTGSGCQDSGPIFIVSMPRAGSTLVDQILSSHSAIEGIDELEDLPAIVDQELERDKNGRPGAYPQNVKRLNAERLRSLGEQYMEKTRRRRKTKKPLFTDKAPINYLHVGLIQLILPNAKIIDARRHPMDCCFSCYKHYFPAGQPLTWDLRMVGRAYVDYVELMAHWDDVLPGRVHRVIYENMIQNPEEEVRRLLDYVGVPFEEQCLRFHETDRFVRTISSEQVRMPMYKTGVAYWKHYEPWLGPLKEALGGVLDTYPEVPRFFPRLRSHSGSWPLGTVHEFDLVKGVRQPPFESVLLQG